MKILQIIKKIGLICLMYKLYSRIFPHDKLIATACARIGAYHYLKRYRYALSGGISSPDKVELSSQKKTVWVCWLQGYDHAPTVVQRCIQSIQAHSAGLEVVLLNQTNLSDYIELPDYVIKKHAAGIIPNAHFSDFIRIMLLKQYGGIWIDATTLLTDELPSYIRDAELFCFRQQPIGKVMASNWLIASNPGNPIICQMYELLKEYWRKENKLVSYSIFHLFWTMVITANKANEQAWEQVPYYDDINCKVLQLELARDFSNTRFQQIAAMSPLHKLTYKLDDTGRLSQTSFYKKILTINN